MDSLQFTGRLVERCGMPPKIFPWIVAFIQTLEYGPHRDPIRTKPLLSQFAPRQRNRNRRSLPCAHCIGGHGCLRVGGAVEIDEYPAAPLILVLLDCVPGGISGNDDLCHPSGEI